MTPKRKSKTPIHKRLVITGLPCPPSTWEEFLGASESQKIVPIFDVFDACESSDPRDMAVYVANLIESFGPDSILCHDLGVPITLLGLLRLKKKGSKVHPRVTIFNGALRKFNPIRANHPIRLQWMTANAAVKEVERRGGKVDERLRPYLPKIRAMYRRIILFGLVEQFSSLFGVDELIGFRRSFGLKMPIQMIASTNDPYIPESSLKQLRKDFGIKRYFELDYGHFPYSGPREKILRLIDEFET